MEENMSNDFKSLLSNFRQATSTGISNNDTSSSSSSTSIQDSIAQFWRVTQLRRATTSTAAAAASAAAVAASAVQPKAISEKCIMNKDETPTTINFHLAICICIIDSLVHESIWRDFIDDGTTSIHHLQTYPSSMTLSTSAEIYIHAKYPEKIQSSWVRTKTISTTYRPNWNDVRIIRAMLALASEALKDHRTTHIIFVTESCIPIAALKDVATRVALGITSSSSSSPPNHNNNHHQHPSPYSSPSIQLHQSFISAYNNRDSLKCTRFDERECFGILSKYFPQEVIYKALPGWCLLSRLHIQSILDLPSLIFNRNDKQKSKNENNIHYDDNNNLWSLFENVWAPEELYFSTCLGLLGYLPSSPPPPTIITTNNDKSIISQSLLFACWDEKAKHPSDRAHPRTYDHEWSSSLIQDLRNSGYMFMRKLVQPIPLDSWKKYIQCLDKDDNLLYKKGIDSTNNNGDDDDDDPKLKKLCTRLK